MIRVPHVQFGVPFNHRFEEGSGSDQSLSLQHNLRQRLGNLFHTFIVRLDFWMNPGFLAVTTYHMVSHKWNLMVVIHSLLGQQGEEEKTLKVVRRVIFK